MTPYDAIIQDVADAYGVSVKDIMGRRRPERIAFPRQVAMFLCRRIFHDAYHHIGTAFGRCHGTVIHAVERINDLPPNSRSKQDVMTLLAQVVKAHKPTTLALPSLDFV